MRILVRCCLMKKTHKRGCTKRNVRVQPSISSPDACRNASIVESFGCRLALWGSKGSTWRCYLTEKHFRHTFQATPNVRSLNYVRTCWKQSIFDSGSEIELRKSQENKIESRIINSIRSPSGQWRSKWTIALLLKALKCVRVVEFLPLAISSPSKLVSVAWGEVDHW